MVCCLDLQHVSAKTVWTLTQRHTHEQNACMNTHTHKSNDLAVYQFHHPVPPLLPLMMKSHEVADTAQTTSDW